jgi:hypothetical protein
MRPRAIQPGSTCAFAPIATARADMAVRIWLRAGTFTGTGHEVDSSTAVYTHVSSDFMNNALRRALAPALGDCSGRKESR